MTSARAEEDRAAKATEAEAKAVAASIAKTSRHAAAVEAHKELMRTGSDIIGLLCDALQVIARAQNELAKDDRIKRSSGTSSLSARYQAGRDIERGREQVRLGVAAWEERRRNVKIADAEHECHTPRLSAALRQLDGQPAK